MLGNFAAPLPSRKASWSETWVTVPQTDTGGLGENPKVDERTLAKELGNLTP